MCGIAGIWGSSDIQPVKAMIAAMNHRGPDDHGVYRDSCVAMGMTRLSIIDVGSGGHQPMQNPSGTLWMVYNGEVYNFQSERRILEALGYSFSSTSDSEVVLRMYEHYGDDFLLRLRGMFALAIFDKRRGPGCERLLLARDFFGIKPLLFATEGHRLVFASELKALLASELVDGKIDPVGLRLLLTYGSVYQPRTILRGVSTLLPAHRIIVEHGRHRIERYWSLETRRMPNFERRPYEELVEETAGLIRESTRMHLISDVPVGAFLSGGVDSSLLVAMMTQMAGYKVKSFSIGFEGEGADLDESKLAEGTAKFLGTEHTSMLVRGSDVRDRIQDIASSLDQPSLDGVNSYFVSSLAAQQVKVVISGIGSDEIFAGYRWFIAMALREKYLGIVEGEKRDRSAKSQENFLDAYAAFSGCSFGALGAAKLLADGLREEARAGQRACHDQGVIDELSEGSVIERTSGLCIRGYLSNQLLRDLDAVSMAHSIEVRVPYLDRVVVDAALSLPDRAKLGDQTTKTAYEEKSYQETGAKRILLDIGKSMLPNGFHSRPKRGFIMPFDAWLKGPLREILFDTLSESQVRKRGILHPSEVSIVKDQFFQNRYGAYLGWTRPWLLIMLEVWCREVLDKKPNWIV
jgi:asparagine synthase (glutamine-hydrolysing)